MTIEGYWQSQGYFLGIERSLRNELQFASPAPFDVQAMQSQIEGVNSVSVHVRRGDYVTNPLTARFHVTCEIDYYERAVEHIARRVDRPLFFVFSDEPEWAPAHFSGRFPFVLVSKAESRQAHEELRLMSSCSHHIIASSSFSWWGAWLGRHAEKLVVAPLVWFRTAQASRDRIPGSWALL